MAFSRTRRVIRKTVAGIRQFANRKKIAAARYAKIRSRHAYYGREMKELERAVDDEYRRGRERLARMWDGFDFLRKKKKFEPPPKPSEYEIPNKKRLDDLVEQWYHGKSPASDKNKIIDHEQKILDQMILRIERMEALVSADRKWIGTPIRMTTGPHDMLDIASDLQKWGKRLDTRKNYLLRFREELEKLRKFEPRPATE